MTLTQSKLGDYVSPVRSVNPIALLGEADFTYVDISSVDRELRAITSPQVVPAKQAPSRARQETAENDVIVSTVRPNLNTVAVVTDEHAGAIASTGFCVLRAIPGKLDARYLFHWISSETTVRQLVGLATGATYPAVSDKAIKSLPFAPPSLFEQQRIAAILDRADSLRRKRQEALRLADEFLQAAYIEALGDPTENPNRWPIFELGELVESTKLGLVRSSEEFGWDLPTPYLRMDSITNDGKILCNKIQGTWATPAEVADFGLKRGDLLFNTRNSRELVGKTALWDGPDGAVFNNNIMRIRFKNSIAPEVVAMQFRLPVLKRELESRKSGTTSVFAIYYKDLRTMPIQVPSEAAQATFSRIAKRTRTYIAKADAMSKEAETLSLALSNKFFSELQTLARSGNT